MVKTVFIPCRSKADINLVVSNILEKVRFEKIGLVTTAQFVDDLAEIKKRLEKAGKTVIINTGRPNPGQVLGCDARAASGPAAKGAECFVYLGTGHFHPLRVAIETNKPVYMVHPCGGIEELPKELVMKHERLKAARLHMLKEASIVGIFVSTKPGQNRMAKALELKKRFEREGKEVFIFAANEIKPDYFIGYGVDAWVNTGCPRIAEDRFERPVIDISEL